MLARMAVNERLTFPPMDVLPDDPRSTIVSTASQKKLVSGKLEQAVKQAIPALRRLVGDRNERVSSQSLDRSIRSGYCEYAVVLAVILVLVGGTIRLVGSNANNAFSSVASSVQ